VDYEYLKLWSLTFLTILSQSAIATQLFTYPTNIAYNSLKNGNQFTNFQTYIDTTKLGDSIKENRIRADIKYGFELDNNTFRFLKVYFSYAKQ
jgi:hypothetical protein